MKLPTAYTFPYRSPETYLPGTSTGTVAPQVTHIQYLYQAAVLQGLPVALWRHPHQSTVHLIADLSGQTLKLKPDLQTLKPGFLISPFINPGLEQTRYLQADVYLTQELQSNEAQRIEWTNPGNDQQRQAAGQQLMDTLSGMLRTSRHPEFTNPFHTQGAAQQSTLQQDYVQHVQKAIKAIQQEQFHKVVPSRTKVLPLPKNYDVLAQFNTLCHRYPNAFVNLVSLPQEGTWLGATPETLIAEDPQGQFMTMALAGTQAVAPNFDIKQAAWREKEIEEQALVSRYIINCFKKIRLREFEEKGPRTVRAGGLIHLRTDFTVDTVAQSFPQLSTVMLELLHPTSAVCGMPKEAALAFLLENESHQRHFFSGFLGPVNMKQGSQLYVNLRCMQLHPDKATLYAGAGVTADSDPEKEWTETELKCRTVGSTLTEQA